MKIQLPIIAIILLLATAGCEPKNQVKWEPFTREKMAEAVQLEKPVIAYFYAAWCPYCYKLKEKTFSDLRVIEALDSYVRLKGDLSYSRSEETMAISRDYRIQGVPTIILFDSKGRSVKHFSGFMPPDQFLELLQSLNAPAQI